MTDPNPNHGCILWPLIQECLPECWSADPAQWTPLQRYSVQTAAAMLRRLTAGIFNLCPITVRPCRRRCMGEGYRYLDSSLQPWSPAMLDGKVYNLTCGRCKDECGCTRLSEIILDPFAYSIIAVRIDGSTLPANAYRVDDWRKLVRIDGGEWPDCQELALPDGSPGTWSVSYWTGTPPDPGASFALTALAVEWWKACQGKPCSLGPNVTSVARQGITYDVDPVLEAIREGRTGIHRVDMWVYSVNPHGLRRRLRVYSPDTVPSRRTTWPTGPAVPPGPIDPSELGVVWVQSIPAEVWTIVHGLDFQPGGVRVTDMSGNEIRGEVTYPSPSTVQITFNEPTSGQARLS